jgi:hypothetical protein
MRRVFVWIAAVAAFIIILVFAASHFADEPLRRRLEAEMNNRLKGYTVKVTRLDFHPVGLSLDLEGLTIVQNAMPDPPVAEIPDLHASVHWRALLSGRLVADFEMTNPRVHFDLTQFSHEAKDPVPMKDKGWQEALEAVYPLKINRFAIRNGDLTYVDKGPFRPLHVSRLNFTAENIRNVRSEKGSYPSPITADGVVFDKGKITLNGRADFLAEPHIAVKADVVLENITLDYFKPISERYHLSVRQGVLSTNGSIEYAPQMTQIMIKKIILDNFDGDYIHDAPIAPTKKIAKEVGKTTREYGNKPSLEVKVDQIEMRGGQVGYINRAAKPAYRVFLSDSVLDLRNLSNHFKEGVARARLNGKFMGSGPSKIELAFRPENKGPDLDLTVSITDTDMVKMNDLFRAYGNFDVVAGKFSFFSEIKIRQGQIDGYVKPLFREMQVYDRRQDKEKSMFRKLYEALVGGVSGLLKNTPRKEVATEVPVSGDIESPQTSTWQTVLNLIQNAFFKAILPGFEREVSGGKAANAATPLAKQ